MTDEIGGRPRRQLRRTVASAVTATVLAGAALAVWIAATDKPPAAGNATQVPTAGAAVTRGSVTQWIRVTGTYGFDGSYTVLHQGAPGILTATAEPGSTVDRGAILYTVDNQPARLLFGDLPAYRTFNPGMNDGPDVRQLEQNLVDLGMDPQHLVTVDSRFTSATAAAIRRWQASWGVPIANRTGELPLGRVVFQPVTLRVSGVTAPVGSAVGPNEPILTGTSTARVVTAEVSADRQALVEVGDEVRVTLPGANGIHGTILRAGRVANVDQPNEPGRPAPPATITVTIGITVPAGAPDLDRASVLVAIATGVRENVLLVPVAAMLARPGGGYQVRLASGGYVEVEPGLFDELTGKVEVSGSLNVGDVLEVPVS